MNCTKNAIDALNAAPECARQLGHDHVGGEHFLLAILAIPGSSAVKTFKALELDPDDLTHTVREMISSASQRLLIKGPIPLSARARKILEISEEFAKSHGGTVGTCDIVSAILAEGENAAAQVLFNAGLSLAQFQSAAGGKSSQDKSQKPASKEQDAKKAQNQKTPTINTYGRDLTELARQGKLDPVVGRTKELRRVIQILCRRTKNNAVLIGEAGVGKTAVVEGLAQAIAEATVPDRMQSKRVIALDMARVVAGTQYRGQFEERLKKIIDETKRSGNIILFLDEIHTMVGAGGAEGAMDAANMLKPALARGELQCVGATTLKEYHKSIEKDAALERRFQSVQIDEPSIEDSIKILAGIAPKYEQHHVVKFSQEALKAAVELTARYLPSRQLPDKAIDAMDETGARLRMSVSARPKRLSDLQVELDNLRRHKDEVVKSGDFDAAAELRDEIQAKAQILDSELEKWKKQNGEETLDVSPIDVAETVSSMSGVPVEKMSAATAEKLLGMEKALGKVVIGQSEAVKAIAKALRRSRTFLGDPRRPVGSFLFLGPTGVGKTHLAKMLAEHVYGDEKALITLDMSEYQEKYSSSRLVGAPPGYVGYDEGGQLTERVRRRPYSVVLFDEFEKANADVCNMLLQILDDGRLTDGQGRVIDFRNTIIICTANLGFDFAKEGHSLGFSQTNATTSYEILKSKLLDEAKRTFRPELLNRFDDMVVFRKLEKNDVKEILKLELARLSRRLEAVDVNLALDGGAEDFLVEKGLNPALGARPLRRVVQDYVEDPLAELLLQGKTKQRMKAHVDKDGARLKIS